jgi:hypothetical protein
MDIEHLFPQLLSGLILLSLGLVFWRLLKFYENREHNKKLGWSNDLLVFFLALIAIAFGILLAYLFLSIYIFSSRDQSVTFPSLCAVHLCAVNVQFA